MASDSSFEDSYGEGQLEERGGYGGEETPMEGQIKDQHYDEVFEIKDDDDDEEFSSVEDDIPSQVQPHPPKQLPPGDQ